jgi:hypothetical protein
MIPKLTITLTLATLVISCTSTTEPTPEPVVLKSATKAYDGARGGVQITSIYYDQADNGRQVGVNDEWIVIEATGTVNTTGWTLNAGDPTQNSPLPAAITNRLVIYTHSVPDSVSSPATSLGYSRYEWAWNNTEPDTARIKDAGDRGR